MGPSPQEGPFLRPRTVQSRNVTPAPATANPFFTASQLPYQLPPFAQIEVGHFREGFERGMADQLAEVAAIANCAEPATFDNTIVALESGGRTLDRVSRVFYLLTSSHTNPAIQEIEAEYAPAFAAHSDAILLNRELFARIEAVHDQRDALDLGAEDRRVLERYHTDYVRAGASLTPAEQRQLSKLNSELATLTTQFGKNLLADTNDSAMLFDHAGDLEGLSEDAIASAAEAAKTRTDRLPAGLGAADSSAGAGAAASSVVPPAGVGGIDGPRHARQRLGQPRTGRAVGGAARGTGCAAGLSLAQ